LDASKVKTIVFLYDFCTQLVTNKVSTNAIIVTSVFIIIVDNQFQIFLNLELNKTSPPKEIPWRQDNSIIRC
jgi:hypothetical protein